MIFHSIKKQVGEKWGNIIFICSWLSFEFLYFGDNLTWPWLTLGNMFADNPKLIQWYEYTGEFGGSLWVLVVNATVFEMVSGFKLRVSKLSIIKLFALITVPILISFLLYYNYADRNSLTHRVVIVQPNIDPYNEKFVASYEEQLQKMLELAAQKTDTTTEYLLFPETALIEELWENALTQSSSVQTLQQFLRHYPKLTIITGASTTKAYQQGEAISATARKFKNSEACYDAYNTALQLDNSGHIQIYHKSKLVPGVERIPYPTLFKPLEKFALDMGGTIGSLGMQSDRTVFSSPDGTVKVAPVICFESVFGEFVSTYVKNGAQFIAVITNDGWWGDTPGYQQHLKYGRLRAIENRRWIARSANTGTSCFISPLGEIQQATAWWTPAVISQNISFNNDLTIYTRLGDYIGRIALFALMLLILYALLIRFKIIQKS